MELTTDGKTSMMIVQTQHNLANVNRWYASREQYASIKARADRKT